MALVAQPYVVANALTYRGAKVAQMFFQCTGFKWLKTLILCFPFFLPWVLPSLIISFADHLPKNIGIAKVSEHP